MKPTHAGAPSGAEIVLSRGWIGMGTLLLLLQSLVLLYLAFRDQQPCVCGVGQDGSSAEVVSPQERSSFLELPTPRAPVESQPEGYSAVEKPDKWTEVCFMGAVLDRPALNKLRENPPEKYPMLPYAYGMKKSVLPPGFKTFAEVVCRGNSDKKEHRYGHMYSQYLDPLRLQQDEVNMLEIGLRHGDSLNVWLNSFPRGMIYGLDAFYHDPQEHLRKDHGGRVKIFSGDQEDPKVLQMVYENIESKVGQLDFIVDDGGHTMGQQLASFTHLFPLVRPGGLYFIEDLQTSYWAKKCHKYNNGQPYCYGGGPPGAKNTTIDLLKSLIDVMHADYMEDHRDIGKVGSGSYSVHPLDKMVGSVQCWRNMCAIRRKFEGSFW